MVGVSTGTIAALVLSVAALVGTVAVCYFKSEEIGAMLRRARRVIKSKVSGTQLDVDEDGSTMYGDGHTGISSAVMLCTIQQIQMCCVLL